MKKKEDLDAYDENIDDSWGDWDTTLEDGLEEDYYPEPNENLKEAVEEYKTQNGIPVMIDPKTGKFFYEEPDNKSNENIEWRRSLLNLLI
jgi:hypothetical protein